MSVRQGRILGGCKYTCIRPTLIAIPIPPGFHCKTFNFGAISQFCHKKDKIFQFLGYKLRYFCPLSPTIKIPTPLRYMNKISREEPLKNRYRWYDQIFCCVSD